jgi:hypothetical protein
MRLLLKNKAFYSICLNPSQKLNKSILVVFHVIRDELFILFQPFCHWSNSFHFVTIWTSLLFLYHLLNNHFFSNGFLYHFRFLNFASDSDNSLSLHWLFKAFNLMMIRNITLFINLFLWSTLFSTFGS